MRKNRSKMQLPLVPFLARSSPGPGTGIRSAASASCDPDKGTAGDLRSEFVHDSVTAQSQLQERCPGA